MGLREFVSLFTTNSFLLLILFFAYWHIQKQLVRGEPQHRNIRSMFILLTSLILIDSAVIFVYSLPATSALLIIFKILLFCEIISFPAVGFARYLYVWRTTKPKISRKINIIVISTIMSINVILAALSLVPNWSIYFEFNGLTAVNLGKVHWIFIILIIIPYVFSLIINFIKWKEAKQRYNPFIILLINIIPLIGLVFQYSTANYHLFLISMILTFVVVVLDLQYHYAITDFLTGLYNRRNLIKHLSNTMANLKPDEIYAGFMLDINNFKSINDRYGHGFGDQVLIDISSLLLQMVSRGNYVARFGGDEFVVIARIYDEIDIEAIRQKIVKACESYNEVNYKTHTITFSIGVATFKLGDNHTSSRFLELIDQRMYADKKEYKEAQNKRTN